MPTLALEGTGARISFAVSGLVADLLTLSLPERGREAIGTSHLGAQVVGSNRSSRLIDTGQMVATIAHDPGAVSLLRRPPETVTITYPIRADQSSPDRLTCTAFVSAEAGGEMTVGGRLARQLTLTVTSDLTFIPGNPPITNANVSPVLEGVSNNGNGTWTALWGWLSNNTVPVTIPIGAGNQFVPAPAGRGQPTVYTPGRQYGKFTTVITGTLVWSLKGPDGRTRTATAGPR
jgi:hypothetical protein